MATLEKLTPAQRRYLDRLAWERVDFAEGSSPEERAAAYERERQRLYAAGWPGVAELIREHWQGKNSVELHAAIRAYYPEMPPRQVGAEYYRAVKRSQGQG